MATMKTMPNVAKKASSALKDGRAGASTKSLAASALSQRVSPKTTSLSQVRSAAKTLASPYSSKTSKRIAENVLSQKNLPFPVKTYKIAGSSLTQKESAIAVRKVAKKMTK